MLTFQQIIQTLTTFWEKQGCIIHQGHSTEVGAGTFNPATFLRCLGPEPYHTVYVEPSIRPTDGRYGENPNRVQLFHQFQVVMKPSPENIQELYLDSLRALGLDLSRHDMRFVHDDWESPTLGAWGLGWEVWCDGMEVTQFTYFQAVASQTLHPISVELAYGIERLAMFIQNVENIFDLHWNETLTFRDISKQMEVEWSTYNFEKANTKMWLRHFDDFEKEAGDLIKEKLPIPAYDFALKASHAFNILDARGVISVTERTGYIARIRDLSRMVAASYLKSREEKGFPLLTKKEKKQEIEPSIFNSSFDPAKTKDFLLEIGSEQLPATFVPIGMKGLEKHFQKFFKENGLSFSSLTTYGTPQRLTIHVKDLAEGTSPKSTEKKGPPIDSAFSAEGLPTPLGQGFLKSIGLQTPGSLEQILQEDSLEKREIKGTSYLFYTKKEPGIATLDLLAEALPKLILQLEFPKKMRWGDKEKPYARPIRWLLALFGESTVPFSIEGVFSGNESKGHAQLSNNVFPIKTPDLYLSTLKEHFVLADPKERKADIAGQIKKEEASLNLTALSLDKVLAKVLHLTEWPKIMVGSFDSAFLEIPQEVLISEMVEHQGYFPLATADGRLCNKFLITADNHPSELILRGNQRVLSARLSDGAFLYKQDLKTPIEQFNEKLKIMTFQKELGSMFEKMERVRLHAKELNSILSLVEEKTLLRAATLCKSDLAATLTQEFPELQGTIGKYYAREQKESEEVFSAIEEHWLPKSESGPLPKTPYGMILSLSDKIDNLLAYFSVGLKPTSSSDPYALKRQTFGLLKMLIEGKHSINLLETLNACSKHLPGQTAPIEEILSFITSRVKSTLEDYGLKKDEIEAGLQGKCIDPYLQFCKIKALNVFRQTEDFSGFHEVYKRVKGFLSTSASLELDRSVLEHDAEKKLLSTLDTLETRLDAHLEKREFPPAFLLLSELQEPLSAFLDQVKIQVDDKSLREGRIALVNKVFCLFKKLLDFSKIQEL